MEHGSSTTWLLSQYLPFWNHLNPIQQNLLIDNAIEVCYPKNSTIHSEENNCAGVMLIKEGALRTYILSDDGREITLFRLSQGDVCILSASCVLSTITFDVHIDATEPSHIIKINAAAYSALESENIYVEAFTYKLGTERFSDVMWTMQQILFMSFDKRMAIFLIDESAKTGSDSIHLTQEQMAKYMGSAREVVTRMLKYFSNEGLVEPFRGGVRILDKKRLRSLI